MTRLSAYAGPGALVVGVGNVGRQDDGLGWAFVDWLEETGACAGAELLRRYQLLLEDADLFARFERVLVVDATRDAAVLAYRVEVPEPRLDVTFTSHAMSVPCVLAAAATCFGRVPHVEVLAVRGYSWELRMGLTAGAAANLAAAVRAVGDTVVGHEGSWLAVGAGAGLATAGHRQQGGMDLPAFGAQRG